MNLIKVENLKVTKAGEVCDRSSVLGNPFVLSAKTEAEREKVIAAYRKYMYRIAVLGRTPEQAIRGVVREHHSRSTHLVVANLECRGRKSFMDELERLETLAKQGEITLLCWCSPLPCHCDKIADYLRWRLA
jgi:Domain of unknown function (DUF4326)